MWKIIQNLPKVSTILNIEGEPIPMTPEAINKIQSLDKEKRGVRYRDSYEKGDKVRVMSGAWSNMVGDVLEFKADSNSVVINLEILGTITYHEFSLEDVSREL